MPTVIIPNKICPHCGGTKWYVHTNYTTCYKKLLEANKRYHTSKAGKEALKRAKNKQQANLTDYYIVNTISCLAYKNGYSIDRKAVIPEQIEKYRINIKLQREINPKQFKTRKREKNIESKKSRKTTAN